MQFVHPEILWALSALSIPIIVHLFNFRKFKKVLFPNVRFLKEVKQETQSKSKLKHLLILISRILALTCIILAFAQPFIPSPNQTAPVGDRAVSVYIDNSFSMEAENENGQLLEVAKNKAIEIVNSYSPSDRFQLLSSDFEGRHQRFVGREEMTGLIQELNTSPARKKWSEVLSRQNDLLVTSPLANHTAYIVGDLQASIADVENLSNDTSLLVRIVPCIAPETSNLFIDSIWFESPVRQINQPELLNVRVVNTGDDERTNIPVRLVVNGFQKSVATCTVPPNGETEFQVNFTNTEAGFKNCSLELDDHPVTFDDIFYFSYNVANKMAVLNIREDDKDRDPISAVFSDDPFFDYTSTGKNAIDFGTFSKQNLVILNQLQSIKSGLASELEKFIVNGGSVLVIPSPDADLTSYNSFVQKMAGCTYGAKISGTTKVNTVNYDNFIYKNAFRKSDARVDLPVVKSWYPIAVPSRSASETLLGLQEGTPFMTTAVQGNGRIYLSAVSLSPEESNFTNHAFFPATLLRIAEFSQGSSELYHFLGSEEAITIRNVNLGGEQTFSLKNVSPGLEIIPEHRNLGGNVELFVPPDLSIAGNYSLQLGSEEVASIAFNYNRLESHLASRTPEEVNAVIEDKGLTQFTLMGGNMQTLAQAAKELDLGIKLWWTMIVWSLIFLAIEILLIKFWR